MYQPLPRLVASIYGPMPDTPERNKQLIRRFVEAINRQDWTVLPELVASDFVRHSEAAGRLTRSRDELIDFLRGEARRFPDAQESIEDLIAEGDKVAARHRFTASAPRSSRKRISASFIAIYRIEDGRIAEAWAEWDNARQEEK